MPQQEHDLYLYTTFCEFFPAWKRHIKDWKHYDENRIVVIMQKDDYMTSGKRYIFGDNGCDEWNLEILPKKMEVRA